MVSSLDGKFTGLLPSLSGRIPRQDGGEDDAIINFIFFTTGDIKNIINHCSSQSNPFRRKLAGLPPLQWLAAISVDGNLGSTVVGDEENLLAVCVLVNATCMIISWLSH